MKALLLSFFFLTIIANSFSQTLNVKVNDPPIPYTGNVEWGNDLLVSSSEPLGKQSGVYRNSDSTIYVAVPDTAIQSNTCVVILASPDNGITWSNITALAPAAIIPKTKMIRSAADSIYCFVQVGNTIYCWNVLNSRITQVRSSGYRDFDVAASSTGSMYIFVDTLGTNGLYRYGSSDGGVTWGVRGNISSGAANPRIYMSGLGDTLVLNYYGPVNADTSTSVIRSVRYRETAPATMAVVGAFSNVAASNEKKEQFASVVYGRFVWFIYTGESGGNKVLKYKVSTNSNVSYTDSSFLQGPEGTESWFDAKHNNRGGGGIDIIYFSSSGNNLASDNGIPSVIKYATGSTTNPAAVNYTASISNHPPISNTPGYIPSLVEYYDTPGNIGAVWVGFDGPKRLYFNAMSEYSLLGLDCNLQACSPTPDTITVLLRGTSSPYYVVDSTRGVLSPPATLLLSFTNPLQNINYYIVVKHRNSIETWSRSGGESFVNQLLTYDFTTSSSKAYGDNMVLVGSNYSFYTGDVNQDGSVDLTDLTEIDNDSYDFVTGYVPTDLNYDLIVDVTDAAFADNNAFNFVGVIRP